MDTRGSGRSTRLRMVLATLGLAIVLATSAHASADPAFPPFTAADLTAKPHRTAEFVGKVTMIVAMTDRGAGDAMSAWYAAADSRVPASVARKSIISLHIPFFITTAYARDQARSQVPERFWSHTFLDRGDMAETLGLSESKVPYVYALDEQGRIVAHVHALVQSAEAAKIWAALSR